jgi:hypothetical protein
MPETYGYITNVLHCSKGQFTWTRGACRRSRPEDAGVHQGPMPGLVGGHISSVMVQPPWRFAVHADQMNFHVNIPLRSKQEFRTTQWTHKKGSDLLKRKKLRDEFSNRFSFQLYIKAPRTRPILCQSNFQTTTYRIGSYTHCKNKLTYMIM